MKVLSRFAFLSRMSPGRRVVFGVVVFVSLIAAYVGCTFIQVWRASYRRDAPQAQAIVVLGAAQYDGTPSPALKARLDHALALWKSGVAPVIVVTGGKQPGDRFTEAASSAKYLIGLGVPDTSIVREIQGRNTYQELSSVALILKANDMNRVVLVSDPFHNLRLGAIADEVGLQATESPSPNSPIGGMKLAKSMIRETAAVALGRILSYRTLADFLG